MRRDGSKPVNHRKENYDCCCDCVTLCFEGCAFDTKRCKTVLHELEILGHNPSLLRGFLFSLKIPDVSGEEQHDESEFGSNVQ